MTSRVPLPIAKTSNLDPSFTYQKAFRRPSMLLSELGLCGIEKEVDEISTLIGYQQTTIKLNQDDPRYENSNHRKRITGTNEADGRDVEVEAGVDGLPSQ